MKSTKATNKIVSLLLVMAMLTSGFCIPQPSVHAETEETITVTNTKPQAEKITQKTENATIYGDGTGKKRAEIYAQDIRFKDEKGKLTDYDTSLKDITERESETGENLAAYDYQTTTTDKMTYFPQKITTKTPILSEYDQYAVKINPKETVQTGTLKKEGKEAMQIAYETKKNGVDYQYESTTDGLKESIILDKKTDQNTFEFNITLKNCSLVSQEDLKKESKKENKSWQTKEGESVFLYDIKEDRLIGTLPAAFMIDAEGNYSEACNYNITLVNKNNDEKQYHMVLKVSKQYLGDADRAYPVTIDPTVTWNTSDVRKFSSAYVCSTAPNSNYTDENTNILCVGKRDTAKDLCRAYLKFEGVERLLAGMYVEKANLELNFHQSDAGMKMYVRQVTSGWGAPKITYSNQPKRAETLAEITASANMGKTTVPLDEELLDSRARDEGRMCGYEITTSKDDSDTSSGKSAWIYNSVSVNGTKIPKLTIEYYDKEDYTDCPRITYKVYDEGKHWSVEGNDGGFAGDNEGEDAMAARAFQASVSANGYSIPSTGIKYRAYSDEAGWSAWKTNGAAAGDTSKTYNMKAVEMQWNTTSAENAYYDLYYRVYVPGRGWLGWAKNAQTAGDYTKGNYISAMEAVIVPKMLYKVSYNQVSTNQKWSWEADSGVYRVSCMDNNRVYEIATKFTDSNMRSKHSILLNVKFVNGTIVSSGNADKQGYVGVNEDDSSIMQYKAKLSDVALRSRYNIEHTGNVLAAGASEEKWKKNERWTGDQLNGTALNSIALRLVPKEYDSGKKACYSEKFLVREDGFSFENQGSQLGYYHNTTYDKNKFIDLFGKTIGEDLYKTHSNWTGSCYGMALTSQLFYHSKLDRNLFTTVIDKNIENTYGLQAPVGKKNKKLRDLIDYIHLTQYLSWYNANNRGNTYKSTKNNMTNLVQKLLDNKQDYIMLIYGAGGHAVIPLKVKTSGENKYVIDIYDVNESGKIVTAVVDTKQNTFRYGNFNEAGLVDINEISTLYKNQFTEIIKKFQNPSYQINNASYMKDANVILAENVAASQITNEEGKCIEDLEGVSKVDDFDNPNSLMYYVPEGTYHVAASDKKDASITFVNYDTSVFYDNLKDGEISATFKKDDSIQSDMKLDDKTDTVKVSTYDKHENETKKICSGKQIKVKSEDNHASIKVVK